MSSTLFSYGARSALVGSLRRHQWGHPRPQFLVRTLFGCGTPREAAGAHQAFLFVVQTENALIFILIGQADGETGAMLLAISSGPALPTPLKITTSASGC